MAGETLEVTAPPPADTPSTPATEQTPDQIEEQLRVTQQALAGKLGVLEEQTLGSIRETVGAVNDAVSTVQSVVANPVEAVQGAVQTAVLNPIENVTHEVTASVANLVRDFDPSAIVRQRPLESVGVAVLGGVVAGLILFGRSAPSVGGRPGLFSGLTDVLRGEVGRVGRELIGTLSRSVVERAKTAIHSVGENGKGYSV